MIIPIRREFMWKLVKKGEISTKKWDYAAEPIPHKEQVYDIWRKPRNSEIWDYIGIWTEKQPQ